jgi:hypothetical protein
MSELIGSRSECRGLWASVVLQALGDIEGEPIESLDFVQAVAFFTGSGTWAESRTIIGDFLEFHRDDLEAAGRRCINARRASERGFAARSATSIPERTFQEAAQSARASRHSAAR